MGANGDQQITSAEYYQFLAEHKLMGTRCRENNKLFVPPRAMDPETYSTDMEWEEVSGKGKLRAFTIITVGPTAMVEEGYNIKNPYCAGFVQLDEGPTVSGQIFGVDVSKPENIKVGMEVKAKFVERGEGEAKRTYLAFEAA